MATFNLEIKCCWTKDGGFESIVDDETESDSGNAEGDMDQEEDGDEEMSGSDD